MTGRLALHQLQVLGITCKISCQLVECQKGRATLDQVLFESSHAAQPRSAASASPGAWPTAGGNGRLAHQEAGRRGAARPALPGRDGRRVSALAEAVRWQTA